LTKAGFATLTAAATALPGQSYGSVVTATGVVTNVIPNVTLRPRQLWVPIQVSPFQFSVSPTSANLPSGSSANFRFNVTSRESPTPANLPSGTSPNSGLTVPSLNAPSQQVNLTTLAPPTGFTVSPPNSSVMGSGSVTETVTRTSGSSSETLIFVGTATGSGVT